MSLFNLNFTQLQNDWTVPADRTPVRTAWLKVISAGLRFIWSEFMTFRTDANRRASSTGQIMSLERTLNLRFFSVSAWSSLAAPTAGGRIWIEDTASLLPSNFIYFDNENQLDTVVYFDSESEPSLFSYFSSEYASQFDFIVKVPASLTYDTDEMRALVDAYKIAGSRYTIETY